MTWKYVDRAGGGPLELVDFLPSPEFLTLLFFFDQYAYSNSVWSPDSSQITFSGILGGTGLSQNGSTPEEFKVYVMDIQESTVPREIATSRFRFLVMEIGTRADHPLNYALRLNAPLGSGEPGCRDQFHPPIRELGQAEHIGPPRERTP